MAAGDIYLDLPQSHDFQRCPNGWVHPRPFPLALGEHAIKCLKKKVWKCIQERKLVVIGLLRSANITQLIVEFVKVVDISLKIPATPP